MNPIITENIILLSPSENSSYIINDTIIKTSTTNIIDKYHIIVELQTTCTEQYRYRKYINNLVTIPPEYKDNGKIYKGEVTHKQRILKNDEYSLIIAE